MPASWFDFRHLWPSQSYIPVIVTWTQSGREPGEREWGRERGRTLDSLSDRPNNTGYGQAMLWTDSYTHACALAPTSIKGSPPLELTITSLSVRCQELRGDKMIAVHVRIWLVLYVHLPLHSVFLYVFFSPGCVRAEKRTERWQEQKRKLQECNCFVKELNVCMCLRAVPTVYTK